MSSDVLIHQQSFDYALSKVCSSIIDWFPTEALYFTQSSSRHNEDSDTITPRNSRRFEGKPSNPIADGNDEYSHTPRDWGCKNNTPPIHYGSSSSIAPSGTSTGSLPLLAEDSTVHQRGILSKGYHVAKAATMIGINALKDPLGHLPLDLTTHTFVSSVGSGTIWDTPISNRFSRGNGIHVVFRSGMYSSIRLSGALSKHQNAERQYGIRTPFYFIGSLFNAAKPLVQFRCSASSEDRTKAVGLRATLQDAQISAMDIILHAGRRRDSTPLFGLTPFFSHMCRIDHHLITNYSMFNFYNDYSPLPINTQVSRHPVLRRIKLGFGVILKSDLSSGINLLWGFCVELLQSIVLAFHIDALRRCCVTASARNILGVSGLSGAMRLRVNLITARQTILDFGVHKRISFIQQIAGEGLQLGEWTWKASCSGEGAVFGGSLEGAEVSSILRKLSQMVDVLDGGDKLDDTEVNKGGRWNRIVTSFRSISNVGYLACVGYPVYYSQIVSDEVRRFWRHKVVLKLLRGTIDDSTCQIDLDADHSHERRLVPLCDARRKVSSLLVCPSFLKDTRLDITCGFAVMSFPLLKSAGFLSSFASVAQPLSDYHLFLPYSSFAGHATATSPNNGSSVLLDNGPSRFWSNPLKVNCFFVVSFS